MYINLLKTPDLMILAHLFYFSVFHCPLFISISCINCSLLYLLFVILHMLHLNHFVTLCYINKHVAVGVL